jgi:Holliday junction resolvase RusA-like endonuclease
MTRARAVKVFGHPAPKGSLKCIGGKGGRHQLIEDNKATKPWRERIHLAAPHLTIDGQPWDGPVGIVMTFTLDRPASVPLAKREWPEKSSPGHGDTDKLARTVLDGLEDSGVLTNDAQVCSLTATKCYPDTPGVVDQMEHTGVLIRIFDLTEAGA